MGNKIDFKRYKKEPDLSGGYFVKVGGYRVDFGGAFLKDIVKKLGENQDKVLGFYDRAYGRVVDSLESQLKEIGAELNKVKIEVNIQQGKDYVVFDEFTENIMKEKELIKSFIKSLTTAEELDTAFDETSKYLGVVGDVVSVIMAVSYTQFDYYRMEKDNWLMLGVDVDTFMENEKFKEVHELLSK